MYQVPAHKGRHKKLIVLGSITTPIKSTAPGRRRYPLTLETMERVLTGFQIPSSFVNFAAAHTTVALDVNFPESTCDANPSEHGTHQNIKAIICVLGPLSLAMSYCSATRTSSAVVLGLCEHQASKLADHLRNTVQVLVSPMLLPIFWLNILGETRAHRVIGRKDALNRTEVDLGIHWGVQHPVRRLQDIDFDIATRRLTVYGSEVAWDIHAIDAQNEMLTMIEAVHEEIYGASVNTIETGQLKTRARHIRQVLSGLMHWTRSTQHRIQIQLQTESAYQTRAWSNANTVSRSIASSLSTTTILAMILLWPLSTLPRSCNKIAQS